MRGYPVKENPIGLAVSEILTQTNILLLYYKDLMEFQEVFRDKTMDDELMYIFNDYKQISPFWIIIS